jgi:hypothetical protein
VASLDINVVKHNEMQAAGAGSRRQAAGAGGRRRRTYFDFPFLISNFSFSIVDPLLSEMKNEKFEMRNGKCILLPPAPAACLLIPGTRPARGIHL